MLVSPADAVWIDYVNGITKVVAVRVFGHLTVRNFAL